MTLQQLAESIAFEAGITDIGTTGGWLYEIILELLDQYAGAISYPEMYMPGGTIVVSPNTSQYTITPGVQRIDKESIVYRPNGDANRDYFLTYKRVQNTDNFGVPKYVYFAGTNIQIFPYENITTGDVIKFNYWQFPSAFLGSDFATAQFPIPVLMPTIRAEVIARTLAMMGRSKDAPPYRTDARAAYNRAMGSINVSDVNGQ